MADEGITDPTGGARNFNIEDVFKSFGYTPTQAEISALAPAFEGRTNVGQTGTSAVAEYVQAHQALGDAQSAIKGNLLDEQTAAKNAQTLGQVLETQGQEAYDAAANVYAQSPKLFGSLTADQIGDFLAPAKAAFEQAQGKTSGDIASRGLGASSIEGGALGQNLTQFMQSVLSQGLSVGMTQQQNQAGVLQNKGSQLMGAGQQQFSLAPQYEGLANASAANSATVAGSMTGLAGSAVNQAIAQQAAIKALNPQTKGFFGQLGDNLSKVALQGLTNLGQNTMESFVPSTQAGNTYGAPTNLPVVGSLFQSNGLTGLMGSAGKAVGGAGGAATGGAATDYTGGLAAGGGLMALA